MAQWIRCPDCDQGLVEGNGKCSKCLGSGRNPSLNSEEDLCRYCGGTGTCATCGGSGRKEMLPDPPPVVQRLFD